VSNHGLDDLVTKQFGAARAFFELPTERKMEIMVDKYHRCSVVAFMTSLLVFFLYSSHRTGSGVPRW